MTATPSIFSLPWPERAGISAVFFCNGLGIGAWAASIALFKARLGLTDGALSLALLGFAAGAVVSMPLTGLYAPRFGVARATRTAALVFSLTLLGPPAAAYFGSFALLTGAAFALGFANGVMDVTMNGQASVIERRWSAPIMSSFHAAFSVGGLAGAGLGAVLAALPAQYPGAMSVGALANVALLAGVWKTLRIDAVAAPGAPGFALPGRAALWLCGCVALGLLCEGAVGDWSAVYLAGDLAASPAIAATAYASFSLAMVAGRLGGDGFVAAAGQGGAVILGGVVATVGLVIALLAPAPVVAIVGFGLVGLGLANVVPIIFSAASRLGSSPAVGVAMAASAGYSGLLLGPPLIGAVATLFSLRAGIALLSLCAFAIALTGLTLRTGYERAT